MNLMIGAGEVELMRSALKPLEGYPVLQKFILAYANVSPDGGRLTGSNTVLEGLIFAIWLEACAAAGLSPADPNCTAKGQPL